VFYVSLDPLDRILPCHVTTTLSIFSNITERERERERFVFFVFF